MAKNLLVINVDIRETRVALIENGIIAELHIERETSKGTLGNIYVGKVSRVLPGMQAAFIDVGLERAAFLHVEDLIRPDDFEAYLAGGRRGGGAHADEDRASGPSAEEAVSGAAVERVEAEVALPTALDVEDDASDDEALAEDGDDASTDEAHADSDEASADDPAPAENESASDDDAEAEVAQASDDAADTAADAPSEGAEELRASESEASPSDDSAPLGEPGDAAPADDADATSAARKRNVRPGRVRRSGRTTDRRPVLPEAAAAPAAPEGRKESNRRDSGRSDDRGRGRGREGRGRGREDRNRSRHGEPPRVSKTTPIREVVREGQEVIVQISKEPIGTKGARVTSHISLPGRYVVYLPTVDHIGISKRIGSEKERARLRDSIESMKPPTGGLIVRTVAEGLTKKQLKADVGYLVRLWGEVVKMRESGGKAPTAIYTELDLVLKTARDLFTDDIEKIVIDSREEYGRLRRFVEMFMPERADAIELYEGEEPIFDAYGIEDEISRALSRKVPLPSGGHLIIDQAEALTAIDVNTGRFVGKGSKDLEDTILKTNLEAVEEIAYQLRFRNIGGLIILDLIDMERAGNREKVRRTLEQLLAKDKAKTTLNRISDLGLIEMTRKRTRESLGRTIHEGCFYCDGTGQLQSKQTVAYEILRQIRRERLNLPGYKVVVNAHPAIADFLKHEERIAVQEAERLFQRRIELVPRKEYHLEQFDLQGR
jgi:ribonuclease G